MKKIDTTPRGGFPIRLIRPGESADAMPPADEPEFRTAPQFVPPDLGKPGPNGRTRRRRPRLPAVRHG